MSLYSSLQQNIEWSYVGSHDLAKVHFLFPYGILNTYLIVIICSPHDLIEPHILRKMIEGTKRCLDVLLFFSSFWFVCETWWNNKRNEQSIPNKVDAFITGFKQERVTIRENIHFPKCVFFNSVFMHMSYPGQHEFLVIPSAHQILSDLYYWMQQSIVVYIACMIVTCIHEHNRGFIPPCERIYLVSRNNNCKNL